MHNIAEYVFSFHNFCDSCWVQMTVAGSHGKKYVRPLGLAVLLQNVAIVTTLLEAGANVDAAHIKCVVSTGWSAVSSH